ncbi:response regulator transcription factor [Chroococcidiopsis sp. CCNUC1]|uniref:response regulator transcription factor n=1 Tax=Chroococcidiopsis sp. CCNUC1 TaxID=2653189 RepID=UPI002020CCB8|nr:response regulator [Chroococcidiopsis sp. CCNUC1]URD52491.1 response regulator [Chroococcidiopsis sp. CCNUC1]
MKDLFCQLDSRKKQVLIVDDLLDNCLLLATILEAEGYEVDTTDCGYKAIAKIEANPPDLVLLDVMMPNIDGYEVAQWISQNQPSVSIVLVTAYDTLPQLDPRKVKIDGFIRKPIDLDEVLLKVETLLATKQEQAKTQNFTKIIPIYSRTDKRILLKKNEAVERKSFSRYDY